MSLLWIARWMISASMSASITHEAGREWFGAVCHTSSRSFTWLELLQYRTTPVCWGARRFESALALPAILVTVDAGIKRQQFRRFRRPFSRSAPLIRHTTTPTGAWERTGRPADPVQGDEPVSPTPHPPRRQRELELWNVGVVSSPG